MITSTEFCKKYGVNPVDFNNVMRYKNFLDFVSFETIKTKRADGRVYPMAHYNEEELMMWVKVNRPDWLKNKPEHDKEIDFSKGNQKFDPKEFRDSASLENEALWYMKNYPATINNIQEKLFNVDFCSFMAAIVLNEHKELDANLPYRVIFGGRRHLEKDATYDRLKKITPEMVVGFLKRQPPFFWRRYSEHYITAAIAYLLCFGDNAEGVNN